MWSCRYWVSREAGSTLVDNCTHETNHFVISIIRAFMAKKEFPRDIRII